MIKLVVGCLILLCLVLIIVGIRAYKKGNTSRVKRLKYIISILAIIVDVIALILPGIDATFNTHIIDSVEQVFTGDRNAGIVNNGDKNQNNVNTGDGKVIAQINAAEGASVNVPVYVYADEAAGEGDGESSYYVPEDFYYVEMETFPTGWWDNSGLPAGRPGYTIEEINEGAIDGKIVFNSITSYDYYGDEHAFVGVRVMRIQNSGHGARKLKLIGINRISSELSPTTTADGEWMQ